MEIDLSEEQLENADLPRREMRLPLSNVTLKSWQQSRKQLSEMTSIEDGMQIDLTCDLKKRQRQETSERRPTQGRSIPEEYTVI
jgi:hypothetical protein